MTLTDAKAAAALTLLSEIALQLSKRGLLDLETLAERMEKAPVAGDTTEEKQLVRGVVRAVAQALTAKPPAKPLN